MRRFAFFLVGLLGAGAGTAMDAERILTLDQSVQTALQNNPQLLSAREAVRIAQQRVAEAQSLLWPSVAVNLNASRYRADTNTVLTTDNVSTLLPPSVNDEADNYYTGRLFMRHVLYNGGRTSANTRVAKAAVEQARLYEEEIRRQVTLDVTTAFYDELLARKKLDTAEEALRELQQLSAALPTDAAAARAVLEGTRAQARRQMSSRRREEAAASLTLRGVLGLELYTSIDLRGDLQLRPGTQDLPKLLARAQESRLEIRGTEYQREMDRLAVYLTEAERYPVVALVAGFERNNREFPLDRTFWNTSLNVSLPLFDGFSSRARIRQSRLLGNQTRIERAALEDRISREVRVAHADLVFWLEECQTRDEESRRLNNLYTEIPKGRDLVEKAQARASVWNAVDAYWDAVHGQLIARARLEKAVGFSLDK